MAVRVKLKQAAVWQRGNAHTIRDALSKLPAYRSRESLESRTAIGFMTQDVLESARCLGRD